jgi:hypothetical protein
MEPNFIEMPADTYLCRVAEVRVSTTRAGDERWAMRLVVAAGEFVGRQAAWDSLVFSVRGRARARFVFAALGLSGVKVVNPADLEGKQAYVEVRPVQYRLPDGTPVQRNEVPYDGYRRAAPSEELG